MSLIELNPYCRCTLKMATKSSAAIGKLTSVTKAPRINANPPASSVSIVAHVMKCGAGTPGVPAPHFMTWATILTELAGGLALILGAFVTLVSLPMAALLLVAIFSVHLQYGFSSIRLIGVTNGGAQFGPVGYECS